MNTSNNLAPKPRRRATYQDVIDAPHNKLAEIVNGELHLQSRPDTLALYATRALEIRLNGRLEGDDIKNDDRWWIFREPEIYPGEDVLVPNLTGWDREKMPAIPGNEWRSFPSSDWVCEIITPATRAIDLEKRTIYAREGMPHLWFLDPHNRTLQVFALRDSQWALTAAMADEGPVSQPPFNSISLPLEELWPPATTSETSTGDEIVSGQSD